MGIQPADSAGRKLKQCTILSAGCKALAHNVFGNLFIEPKDISTASVRVSCLFIKGTGLLNLG
jgi:hypothetical protein